jgi:predicted enzyme related to lactoylglutathione lyase
MGARVFQLSLMRSTLSLMSIAHHVYTAVDCSNPKTLARFYAEITGWDVGEIEDAGDEWVDLFHDGVRMMAFQKVANYIPPTWPEGPVPQQLHFDFHVKDLDVGESKILAIGATKHAVQPGTNFRVYLDPEGHPFCLVKNPQ